MLKGARRRRGFTLIETVVTVGIVATLAAVVVPQVVKQFDITDPARVAEDMNNIRTAVETFKLNVKPNLPFDIEDLVNKIQDNTAAFDSTAYATRYSASDVANWNGPYITLGTANDALASATVLTTGFGATVQNQFYRYDVDDVATVATGGTIRTMGDIAFAEYLAVRLDGLSNTQFAAINDLVDGSSENTDDLRRWQGRLRCPGTYAAGADCGAAYFLLVSIR